ncbi:repulsive guidance molecule A-like [Tachypleus tridentatus]|uniref:repulsive guidance molecule A-like n=1 Tax=Tachypleus tridentatus TaxID=6853 RepID=UPI003FCF7E91
MGMRPNTGCTFSIQSIVLCLIFASSFNRAGSFNCKVEHCSAQYQRATHAHIEFIRPSSSYYYCTVLHSYSNCIRATARSCRGNLNYHTISSLVMQWFDEYNCSDIILNGIIPTKPVFTHRPTPVLPAICSFAPRNPGPISFSHCGLFGDPHLRTFYDEFQTCYVQGAWPLIDNPYLAVQVTNEPVTDGFRATAVSKVTVIVRDYKPCTQERTFESQTNNLPGMFNDGSKGKPEVEPVFVWEVDPGSHVEIYIRYIATRIVIRQVGSYLTFAIKMPEEVAIISASSENLQLCVKGCPRRERIDHKQFLAHPNHWISKVARNSRPAVPVQQAVELCRQRNVVNFYFDACVFDVLTTGDSSFTLAAEKALEDAPSSDSEKNRTYLLIDKENSAPGRSLNFLLLLMLLLFICISDLIEVFH